MSVIVMRMEMPRDCPSCPLSYWANHTAFLGCRAVPGKRYAMREEQYRKSDTPPDWCPLQPLPEKHGRLGDLDELQSSFRESIDECKKWIKELEENGDNETLVLAKQAFCTFVEAALRLKSIPTIVEAEGG